MHNVCTGPKTNLWFRPYLFEKLLLGPNRPNFAQILIKKKHRSHDTLKIAAKDRVTLIEQSVGTILISNIMLAICKCKTSMFLIPGEENL